jgi:hypothetical protein
MPRKAPPIPPEQRSFSGEKPDVEGGDVGRRDRKTGLQSSQPGDDDVNLKTQGRQANIRQNLTPQRSVQDR